MRHTIELARTVSKNFQSIKSGYVIEVPEDVKLSDAQALIEFMVRASVTKQFDGRDILKYQETYQACFQEPIERWLEVIRPPEVKQ